MRRKNKFKAEANRNRSQTWRIYDVESGKTVRDHLLNGEVARYTAMRMNAEHATQMKEGTS